MLGCISMLKQKIEVLHGAKERLEKDNKEKFEIIKSMAEKIRKS